MHAYVQQKRGGGPAARGRNSGRREAAGGMRQQHACGIQETSRAAAPHLPGGHHVAANHVLAGVLPLVVLQPGEAGWAAPDGWVSWAAAGEAASWLISCPARGLCAACGILGAGSGPGAALCPTAAPA